MGAQKFSFENSGQGEVPLEMNGIRETAVGLGYAKAGVDPSKPLAARADMVKFFQAYGCNSLTQFKAKYYSEKLTPVGPGGKFFSAVVKPEEEEVVATVEVKEEDIPDVSKFDELAESFPTLKWRLISRPGGATMKPVDFYRLDGAKKQVEIGDVNIEKPMWAEHGGLDFNGREAFDQWEKFKGYDKEKAKKAFCRVYAEAQANPKANFRMY